LNEYLTRENWSPYDLFFSNIVSYPADKFDVNHPIPNYLIYRHVEPNVAHPYNIDDTQFSDLQILTDPDDPRIPANFEILFKSNITGTVVYKINPIIIDE
jgi:hypothetical protein